MRMSSGSIFILGPGRGRVVLMSDPMQRQTSLQLLLVLGDRLKFKQVKILLSLSYIWKYFVSREIQETEKSFGTILIFQSCEPTCTSCFPCPSGYDHALLGMEMHKIYCCAWQKASRVAQDLGTGIQVFWESTIPYISEHILVIMSYTSDMKHFSVTI